MTAASPAPGSGSGLRLIRTGLAFPFVPSPPIHCRSLGDRLCVAAVEGMVRESRIIFLDAEGEPEATGLVLPFLVTGLDSLRGELVLTGTRPDGPAVAAGVDTDTGTVGWIAELAMPRDLTRVAEPIAAANGLEVVWQSGLDQTTLWSTEVSGGALASARALRLDDLTSDSAFAAVGDHVVLARVHGERQQLDLLWLHRGEAAAILPIADGLGVATPSVGAASEDAAVVAWPGGDGLRVSRVEAGSLQPTAELGVPLSPGQLRSCNIISGGEGRTAIVWHAELLGDPEPLEEDPGRFEPARTIEGWVATVDTETWQLTAPVRLSPPGTFHHQGGWVGDRLVLVHGDQQPVITLLEQMR